LGAGQGIAIRSLDANSPLVQAGLEVGDVILEVNGQPVEGPDSFINLLESVPSGEQIAMLVVDHRTGRKGYVELQRN
jgi:serine protease Do